MAVLSGRLPIIFLALLLAVVLMGTVPASGHPKQVQVTGDYEITYFSDPQDPIAESQATLFIQVREASTLASLQVYHFVVEMIPPTGPRLIQHPLSNNMVFVFNQPGNWILLFEIGLTSNLLVFDTSATFLADVTQAQASGLLAAFASVVVTAVQKSYQRWGHISAVVLWLGMMLHVTNTYRLSSGSEEGLANFARTFREADLFVAVAIGLLIVTGVLRMITHGLTTVDLLFGSVFGLVLVVKILLASGMIAIGLFNRVYLLTRLQSLTLSDGPVTATPTFSEPRSKTLARRVFYLVVLEMTLGVVAILFGTVFTQIHTINV